MQQPTTPTYGWGKRLLWLAAIWVVSIGALGVAAYAMRLVMRAAGMSS